MDMVVFDTHPDGAGRGTVSHLAGKLASAALALALAGGAVSASGASLPQPAFADDGGAYELPVFVTDQDGGGEVASDPTSASSASSPSTSDQPSSERPPSDFDSGEKLRDSDGRVSVLSETFHNPYHGQKFVTFDLGAEFARYSGDTFSEGILVKCSAGDVLPLPRVVARDGYTFVGWSTGGVPEEVEWPARMREAEISESIEDKHIYIYAIYADDDGNGYCTCGAYKEGVYKDKLDQLKAEYRDYSFERDAHSVFPAMLFLSIVVLVIVITLVRREMSERRPHASEASGTGLSTSSADRADAVGPERM